MAEKWIIDNRGTKEVPFGFVYLDNTRVGFAADGTFASAGWEWPTDQQFATAEDLLDNAHPGWKSDPA